MVHPIVRKAYHSLPPALQQQVKLAFKVQVERRRIAKHFEDMVRDSVRLVNVRTGVTGPGVPLDDHALTERLLGAYRLADAEGHRTGTSMWTDFFERMHGDIHRVFLSGDVPAAAALLRDPGKTNLFYGFDGLAADILLFAKSGRWRNAHAASVADSLVRLAELLGARRYPNTEVISMVAGSRAEIDADTLLPDIDKALGFHLPNPNPFPDEHGLATSRGIMAYRAPQAVWQARRIRDLTHGIADPAVLEIGGGLGRTAFYARLMGIRDYTIIDLPLTSLAQGSFLGRVLGEESISLLGENADAAKEKVKLLSPQYFLNDARRYDLIVNVDSLTEMSREVASAYVGRIVSQADMFLSINHEANPFTVRELLAERNLGRPVTRTPYPMRNGYIEETVDFRPGA